MLGVVLEPGALEVLGGIRLTVGWVDLIDDVGQREALLRQPAILLPVLQEAVADLLAGLGERGTGGRGGGRGRAAAGGS